MVSQTAQIKLRNNRSALETPRMMLLIPVETWKY